MLQLGSATGPYCPVRDENPQQGKRPGYQAVRLRIASAIVKSVACQRLWTRRHDRPAATGVRRAIPG